MIKESFPFDILNLFDTKGTPPFNFSNQYLNPNTKILDFNNATLYEVDLTVYLLTPKRNFKRALIKLGNLEK